jgi:hypothetical protein
MVDIHNVAPQKEFVGKLIGLSLFNIILNGIFPGFWLIGLIGFFLFLGVLDAFVKFLKHPERDSYPYQTTLERLKSAWIGFIIVRIVMSIIFQGFWVGEIAPAVLIINALEQTYIYYQMKQQEQRRMVPPIAATPVELPVPVAATEMPLPKFCVYCGTPREPTARFCSDCGTRFE